MGRSAKLHKRTPKKQTSTGSAPAASAPSTASAPQSQARAAAKRAGLKGKSRASTSKEGGVLGGADYVALMMGGRKAARAEARKLPPREG